MLALDPGTLIDALRRIIKPGSPELRRRLKNAKRISRPAASFDIAQCILSYLPAHDEQSVWQSAQWQRRQRSMSGRLRSAIRIRRLRSPLPKTLLKNPRRLLRTPRTLLKTPGTLLKNPMIHRFARFRSRELSSDQIKPRD